MSQPSNVASLQNEAMRKFPAKGKVDQVGVWGSEFVVEPECNLLHGVRRSADRWSLGECSHRSWSEQLTVEAGGRNLTRCSESGPAINGLNGGGIGNAGGKTKGTDLIEGAHQRFTKVVINNAISA